MKNSAITQPLKRKWLTPFILLTLLLIISTAFAQSYGTVYNTNSLNLRADASSSSSWLGAYSRGTWVEITGSRNNFYYVTTPDGNRGYMSKNYIQTASDHQSIQIALVRNANSGSFLNFRSTPSYSGKVLGIFYNGVPLKVLSYNDGWYQVHINGQTGYVRQEFVTTQYAVGSTTVATIKTPNNTAINLRNGPGTGHGTIRQFPGDRYVMVLAQGNGWWNVSIDGYVGYMSSDFLVEGLRSAKDLGGHNGGSVSPYALVNNPRSTQALNLRMQANTSSAILQKLYNGRKLYVDKQGTEWCAVTVEDSGLSGYVMTRYIKLFHLPATPTKQIHHPQGAFVNLRSEPNLSASIRAQVPSGRTVTVVSPGGEWLKVSYNGITGYMLGYFLK